MKWLFTINRSHIRLFGINVCWRDAWTGKWGLEISPYSAVHIGQAWVCIGFGRK
jgi:hypothetical protein